MSPEQAALVLPDGVALRADIWRPDAAGPHPVLLMRHAYGRTIASSLCYAHPAWYAAQGYIVVIQDVRGRGESGGAFRLFDNEAADGAATIAWAAALPGSSGAVGMFGFSYQGTNQLLAASDAGEGLRAIAPAMFGWDIYRDWATENGAIPLDGTLRWAAQMAAEGHRRAGDTDGYMAMRGAAQGLASGEPNPSRPASMQRYGAQGHYADWLDRPADDPYWWRMSPCHRQDSMRGLPMLFIGGFYDSHLTGTLAAWDALHPHVPGALVIGPWAHFPWQRRLGDLDFGAAADSDIDARQIAFFDQWLKGRPAQGDPAAPVRLFDMGLCQWRDLPALAAPSQDLWTAGSGRAACDLADGVLAAVPGSSAIDYLVHDPWRPAPSRGGCLGAPPGPFDRAGIDARPDVLTFTTPAAAAPFTLAGRVAATVAFQTGVASCDLHCVLSRITVDGRALPLTEGYTTVADAALGAAHIPMRATCVTIQPGEALRLSIAGACFPAFPVNPGNGVRPCDSPLIDARPIAIGVRHGPAGTRLHLPLLEGAL